MLFWEHLPTEIDPFLTGTGWRKCFQNILRTNKCWSDPAINTFHFVRAWNNLFTSFWITNIRVFVVCQSTFNDVIGQITGSSSTEIFEWAKFGFASSAMHCEKLTADWDWTEFAWISIELPLRRVFYLCICIFNPHFHSMNRNYHWMVTLMWGVAWNELQLAVGPILGYSVECCRIVSMLLLPEQPHQIPIQMEKIRMQCRIVQNNLADRQLNIGDWHHLHKISAENRIEGVRADTVGEQQHCQRQKCQAP